MIHVGKWCMCVSCKHELVQCEIVNGDGMNWGVKQ